MATDRIQLSTWVEEHEADQIRAAAAGDARTVSSWLRLVALAQVNAAAAAAASDGQAPA